MEEFFKADAPRLANRGLLRLFAITCLPVLPARGLEAQQPDGKRIERIDIEGNRRVESAGLRACIISRPGDTTTAKTVSRDVQALRDTGFFEDVRVEVEYSPDQPNSKLVVFILREKPIVSRIEYRGNKSITGTEILSALKDKKVGLSVGDWFDQTKLTRAAFVIKGLLSARGSPSAAVKPTFERLASSNTVNVVFDIDEGPKSQPSSNPL